MRKRIQEHTGVSSNENSPAFDIRYRMLFENSDEGILILDAENGQIIDLNLLTAKLLGGASADFFGKDFRTLGLFDEEVIKAAFEELQNGGSVRLEALRLKTNGETARIVNFTADTFAENDRLLIQCRIGDRTEYQRMEREMRRHRFLLAATQRIAHLGSWEYDLRTEKAYWSDELYRIFNLPAGTFENNAGLIRGFIHPEDRADVNAALEATYRDGTPYDFENRIIRSDGEERVVHCLGEVTFDEAGAPVRISGTLQDITERKRIEREKTKLAAQLEYEKNRLNTIIDDVPVVIWEAWGRPRSAEQKIYFVNNYAEKLLGYDADNWKYSDDFWESIIHPDDREKAAQISFENFLEGRNYTQKFRWIRKDGQIVWVESNVVIILDNQGNPIGRRGINLDITERMQLIAELEFEKTRLQLVFDNSPAFIVSMRGPDFVFEMVNPAFYQIVGNREMIGTPARIALPELVGQGFFNELTKVYKTGVPFIGSETPAQILPPGKEEKELRYINFAYLPQREADGTISGIFCYGIDVTEQVEARRKIQESERRYRFLFENNPLPMWVFDAETLRFLSVNAAACDHYGYSRDEFLSMTLKDIRPPEDVPLLLEHTKKAFSGRDKAGVFRHRKKDGGIIYVEITSSRLDFNGRRSELVLANDITERKLAEDAMRQAETNYRNLVESSPGIVYRMQPHPPYATIYVSPNVEKYGYSAEEWYTGTVWSKIVHREDLSRVKREFEAAVSQGLESSIEYRVVMPDGSIRWWQDKGQFVTDEHGKKIGWQGIAIDITDTKELQEQLRQSQKLESVGRLAGGLAHDFNNMLTAINGYSELALRKLSPENSLYSYLTEIKKAGERSASLTQQLLAFSRQQILQPKIIDLNEIIADTNRMLRRLIGEDIELELILDRQTSPIEADPGQLTQVVVNLVVNARDALPQGGKITIETRNVRLDNDFLKNRQPDKPGDYVMLAIGDNGSGMDEATRRQIFEPFFTTKPVGKGTGLGLATVYGIVKQSGGFVRVESEIGKGAIFRIYLPQKSEKISVWEKVNNRDDDLYKGTETILLVEDEEAVRSFTKQTLEECGYRVLEAGSGVEALKICGQSEGKIDLLMTDVVMPDMSGREVAQQLTEMLTDLKVLFTSGYTDDAIVRHGMTGADINFLQKPFTFESLSKKVRETIDSSGAADTEISNARNDTLRK